MLMLASAIKMQAKNKLKSIGLLLNFSPCVCWKAEAFHHQDFLAGRPESGRILETKPFNEVALLIISVSDG